MHDTYPTATAALGRVMSGALLLSSFLKDRQKVMLQVSGDGPLQSVVAEADWAGRVRGYVKRPQIRLAIRDGKRDGGGRSPALNNKKIRSLPGPRAFVALAAALAAWLIGNLNDALDPPGRRERPCR